MNGVGGHMHAARGGGWCQRDSFPHIIYQLRDGRTMALWHCDFQSRLLGLSLALTHDCTVTRCQEPEQRFLCGIGHDAVRQGTGGQRPGGRTRLRFNGGWRVFSGRMEGVRRVART